MNELTNNDRQRIEQFADSKDRRLTSYHQGLMDGSEYATIYEREQQAKVGEEIERLRKWKEDATALNSRTATKRVELEKRIKELEAERSELRNKVIEEAIVVLKSKGYGRTGDDTDSIIFEVLNSLKTK